MHIAVSHSRKEDASEAVHEAFQDLRSGLDGPPDLIFAYYSQSLDPNGLADALAAIAPEIAVQGGSSSQGVLVNSGFISGNPAVLGLFGIHDPDGDFGVGLRDFDAGPRQAGAGAIRDSLQQAGRPGESPLFVWMTATPGCEEEVLSGIESVLGPNIPVMGGSAADDAVCGDWSIIGGERVLLQGVAVTCLFPSSEPGFSFHSGYSPSEHFGIATKTDGRILQEIDGRPAAQVYNEWTGGAVSQVLAEGGDVLHLTNWYPLARFKHQLGKVPLYLLSHPEKVLPDQSMSLFTEIDDRDRITLMTGSRSSLVNRPARVVESVLLNNDYRPEQINGALIVFCGGSMLAVRDDLDEARRRVRDLLGDVPFLTIFTFGEQGSLTQGANYHGNLMVSVILFSNRPSAL